MMRIGLFLATNFGVLIVLSIVLNVLGLNQQGTGAIRQPIPSAGESGGLPIDWVAGAICFQRSSLVGSAGVVSTYQVIAADCLSGWDSYCSSDCQSNVGGTFETIDPTALVGG